MDQGIGSSFYILLLNTAIIFQSYAIIAQTMLSFPLSRLSSDGLRGFCPLGLSSVQEEGINRAPASAYRKAGIPAGCALGVKAKGKVWVTVIKENENKKQMVRWKRSNPPLGVAGAGGGAVLSP